MLKKKIVIGTANFNQSYGLLSHNVKEHQIKKILKLCRSKKIQYFDTSSSYKSAQNYLSNFTNKNSKIITKLPPIKLSKSKKEIKKWIDSQLSKTFVKLKTKTIYALILHRPEILLSKKGQFIFDVLNSFKKKGKIKKIGVSVYDFDLLKKIIKKYKIDIAQVPFSVFDQRLKYQKNFKNYYGKIEIHCRSIFLQGLIFKTINNLPVRLKNYKKTWVEWKKFLIKNKISPMNAALEFLIENKKFYSKIVVGLENSSQLNEILAFKSLKKKFNFTSFHIKEKKIKKPNFFAR